MFMHFVCMFMHFCGGVVVVKKMLGLGGVCVGFGVVFVVCRDLFLLFSVVGVLGCCWGVVVWCALFFYS